jgi:uncharacterized DUF497 family protein
LAERKIGRQAAAYCYGQYRILPGIGVKHDPTWPSTASRSRKRRPSFFLDESARLIDDPDHSEDEDRFLLLGYSFRARCLIVGHCYQESNCVIRLISARRATARRRSLLESQMREEYDFSKSRKNPYAKQLKRQITIRLDTMAVTYFKQLAAELGMPYQNLINLFLRECAVQKRRPTIQWPADSGKQPLAR